jgi:hypothetical protein
MKPESVYEIWIPPEGVWSLWARPVPFAQMASFPELVELDEQTWLAIDVGWAADLSKNTALVVDLPGLESIWTGLAMGARGYRPVPLYNACTGPNEVVEMKSIMQGLLTGAGYLGSLALPADAPPAFLLDANRMAPNRVIRPGDFDNRSKVFPQDFPSARFLIERGFGQGVLVQRGGRQPQEDLAHVLRRWADAGIEVQGKNLADAGPLEPIDVAEPPWYRSIFHRIRLGLGPRDNPQGGFGREVPRPSSHG